MENSQKGFIVPLAIVLAVLAAGGFYYYTRSLHPNSGNENTVQNSASQKADYQIYKNSKDGYQFDLPQGWKISEQGSNAFAFPEIKDGESIDDMYRNNQSGITVAAFSPATADKRDQFYIKLFPGFTDKAFPSQSDTILAVKTLAIPPADIKDPAYGYAGIAYAIKTAKRVYAIQIFYRNQAGAESQERNIERIIATLKE